MNAEIVFSENVALQVILITAVIVDVLLSEFNKLDDIKKYRNVIIDKRIRLRSLLP